MMDSMIENDPTLPLDFDISSINYLNRRAKRLNDFSMLESPHPKQSEPHLLNEDSVAGREKMRNGRYSNDHSPERPVSRGVTTMREQENLIGELKKECFGLKLRIYYMEEQLRDTFDANIEDILKENVELKVAVEELKNNVTYKTELLAKASQAMEQMSGEDCKQHQKEGQESIEKTRRGFERKLDEKDEQIKKLEDEVYQLNEKLSEEDTKEGKEENMQKIINEKDEKYKSIVLQKQQDEESLKSMICELEQTLATKEGNIEMLRNDLRRLASNNTDRGSQHYKTLYERTGKTISEKENTIAQLKTELTCKSKLVDSLNEHVASLENGLKETREASEEKEVDLQKTVRQLQEQVKKLKGIIIEKGREVKMKDKALTEANEEKLLVHQQKVQYELDSMKTKDSHIIELEIKVKQQHIDLEKTLDEQNRSMKEKKDDVLRLQGLYVAAQQEIKRMKADEKEYKSLNIDLQRSIEKSIENEKNISFQLDNLVSNEQTELEKVPTEFIKNLQLQLKDRDDQIREIKSAKNEINSSASQKQQELRKLIDEKDVMITDLRNSLSMKEKEVNDMEGKVSDAVKLSEHNHLLTALLKDKSEKDEVLLTLTKSLKDKDEEISKISAENDNLLKKTQLIESLKEQVEELKAKLGQVESEKLNLETKFKTVKITKESLQKQLENIHSQSSKGLGTQESSIVTSQLKELQNVFEGVIGSYKVLMDKLKNNQHPDSQLRLVQQEFSAVEHTRESFEHVLRLILNELPNVGNDSSVNDIMNKEKALKIQLHESRKRTSSLEEQLHGMTVSELKVSRISNTKYQKENEVLKKDLKRYETNEKKLMEQIEKMKMEYEQFVSEREEEISVLMKNMSQEKQVIELLTQQKDILSKQLDEKQKKITQDTITLENANTKLGEKSNEHVKLENLVQNKENCIVELRNEIAVLQTENEDLLVKLSDTQSELRISNDNLSKLTSDLKNAELNCTSLETQLSTSIETGTGERKNLKKDVKELFEMNVRLRKKVKAYELVISKKDSDIEKLKEQLNKAGDTTKKLEVLLSNSNEKTALEGELQYLRTKIEELESINERYSSLKSDHINLQEKVNELSKANELHEASTLPELKKLKELVDIFTKENITLKSELHKIKQEKTTSVEKYKKELDAKTNGIQELQNELDKLGKNMEDKANESKMLEYALEKKTKEIDELKNQLTSLENDLQKQSDSFAEKFSENAKLKDEIGKKVEEINEKTRELTNLQNTIQKQSREVDEKESDNNTLRKTIQKLSNEIDGIKMENKNLQIELQKTQDALENNNLTDKLTSDLIQSKSLISSLQSQIAFCSGNHGDVIRLKEQIKHLEDVKKQLKEDNRKLKESAGEMSQKLSITLDNNNIKLEEIKVLKSQMLHLEEKIESFSPLYTSSAHNIALSSDAFTQTQADVCVSDSSDSLIMQHIKEMQQLRKQLEETINNNDSLRMQLEERLNEVEQDASLLQDPHLRITLIRDNDTMRVKLNEAENNQKKLKHQIEKLKEEKESNNEAINSLNSQIHELNVIATNLKMEMEIYDRLIQQLGINKNKQLTNEDLNPGNGGDLDKNLLLALLEEIRDLRDQLQLTIDVNNQLREKLEKELGHPVPVEEFKTPKKSHMTPRSLFSGAVLRSINTDASRDASIAQNTQSLADYPSLDETPTKDIGIDFTAADATPVGAFYNFHPQPKVNVHGEESCVISGKPQDFKRLKEICAKVLDKLSSCVKKMKSQKGKTSNLISDMVEVLKLVKELSKLLSTFTILDQKDNHHEKRVNDSTSEFEIATKLLKACDTLKATKGNLQLKSSVPPSRNCSPSH